jgi:hypothetical protein
VTSQPPHKLIEKNRAYWRQQKRDNGSVSNPNLLTRPPWKRSNLVIQLSSWDAAFGSCIGGWPNWWVGALAGDVAIIAQRPQLIDDLPNIGLPHAVVARTDVQCEGRDTVRQNCCEWWAKQSGKDDTEFRQLITRNQAAIDFIEALHNARRKSLRIGYTHDNSFRRLPIHKNALRV